MYSNGKEEVIPCEIGSPGLRSCFPQERTLNDLRSLFQLHSSRLISIPASPHWKPSFTSTLWGPPSHDTLKGISNIGNNAVRGQQVFHTQAWSFCLSLLETALFIELGQEVVPQLFPWFKKGKGGLLNQCEHVHLCALEPLMALWREVKFMCGLTK